MYSLYLKFSNLNAFPMKLGNILVEEQFIQTISIPSSLLLYIITKEPFFQIFKYLRVATTFFPFFSFMIKFLFVFTIEIEVSIS